MITKNLNKKIFAFLLLLLLIVSFPVPSKGVNIFDFKSLNIPQNQKTKISAESDYPLGIMITSNREKVKNDGQDAANITVTITNKDGIGVAGVNVRFRQMRKVVIIPAARLTNIDGQASFSVSSNQEQVATFQLQINNPFTGEIYSSNTLNISFLDPNGLSRALRAISDFRENPITRQTVVYVGTPVVTILAGLGAYSSIINAINSILPYLNYLINLLLQFLGIRKKQKPWGVIYDSMTKEPVALAIARLYNQKTKSIVSTVVTDKTGRFGFPSLSGKYKLKVSKYSYIFPSKLIKGAKVDGKYSELYFGDSFSLKKNEKLSISVPIDLETAIEARVGTLDRLKNISAKISLPYYIANLVIALLVLWVNVTLFNEILVLVYLLMIFLRKRMKKSLEMSWGTVFNSKTKEPVSGVPIKLFDKKYDKLRETKVSDEKGKFNFILPKGEYYIRTGSFIYALDKKAKPFDKYPNYDGKPFKSEENEVVNFNIPVKKQ